MKHYRIVPNDVIVSGSLSYSFDPIEKTINYAVKARVKKWFITKDIDKSGSIKVEPEDLLSEKFKLVGKRLSFGPLTVFIQSVKGNTARGEIEASLGELKGHATYDLSEKYVAPITIQGTGSLMGISFKLNVEPA
jgi:hypothetical protein